MEYAVGSFVFKVKHKTFVKKMHILVIESRFILFLRTPFFVCPFGNAYKLYSIEYYDANDDN